jgi:hypothetical protein
MKRLLLLLSLLLCFVSIVSAQHSAVLTWTDNTPNVTFNVYRAPCTGTISSNTCSQEGLFQILANVSALTYTDSAITAGAQYSWYTTALDSSGDESLPSNHFAALVPGGSSGGGLISFVQVNAAQPQNANSATAPFNNPQTAGDTNIVVVGWSDATNTVTAVRDMAGNAYSILTPKISVGSTSQVIYIANSIFGAASNSVNVAFSGTSQYIDARIAEYSGIASTSPIDATSQGSGNSANAITPAVTTQNANDILIAAATVATSVTGSGSGFTTRIIPNPDGDILEDKLVSTTGSYTASAPLSSSGNWVMQMAALKAASGVIPPTVTGVTPTCSPTTITTAQTSQCTATVQGTNNPPQTVTWTATGGSINSSGLFTPSTTGTAVVTATSTFDTTKHGSANVTVTAPVASLVMNCSYSTSTKTTTCTITGTVTGSLGVTASEGSSTANQTVTIP